MRKTHACLFVATAMALAGCTPEGALLVGQVLVTAAGTIVENQPLPGPNASYVPYQAPTPGPLSTPDPLLSAEPTAAPLPSSDPTAAPVPSTTPGPGESSTPVPGGSATPTSPPSARPSAAPPAPDAPVASLDAFKPVQPVPAWLSLQASDVTLPAEAAGRFTPDGKAVRLVPRQGGAWMAWTDGSTWATHAVALDDGLAPTGTTFTGPAGFALNAIVDMPDGGLALLADHQSHKAGEEARTGDERWVIRFDASGHERFRTLLTGSEGRDVGKDWGYGTGQLAHDGERLGAYFGIWHNWADAPGTSNNHEGDVFYALDAAGKLEDGLTSRWNSSHSFFPHVLAGPEHAFWTLTTGDAFPCGDLFMDIAPGKQKISRMVWPADGFKCPILGHNPANGRLGGWTLIGDTAYGVLSTADPPFVTDDATPRGILMLALGADGTLRRHAWIQGLGYGQQGVWAERMGQDLFVAWGFEDAAAKGHYFAWVDPATGKPRYPAVKLAAGLDPDDAFTAMPDGSVAWAHVDADDAHKVTVYRARPAGGTP